MQGRVKDAVKKILTREKTVNEKSLKEELDMGPKGNLLRTSYYTYVWSHLLVIILRMGAIWQRCHALCSAAEKGRLLET